MLKATTSEASLLYSLAQEKRSRNYDYLMELKEYSLLFPYYEEAGLAGSLNYNIEGLHGGWDSPLSQIRGTFTGHWLSAAARIYDETKDMRIKAKGDYIVAEIAKCAEANGGGWAFPIPEKYLHALKRGQHFWAPQYVCHKVMMGLLDMYVFAGNEQALQLVKGCADWFYQFSSDISREQMDKMMDMQESGGIMELWCDIYAITQQPEHLELAMRYQRPRLTEPLLRGEDILTNRHANTTVPEIQGCARAYEVTGDERFREMVESYWDFAVRKRGLFATGGQTSGEVWTPIGKQSARLSDMNQEHCVVYNLIRLADYLYRWSGGEEYADFIERNIWNGLFAQGFWQNFALNHMNQKPESGLITYYLPLAAGSTKKWGSKTQDFWCCHCTLVQANAKYREYIYYKSDTEIVVAQYLPCKLQTEIAGVKVTIEQTYTDLSGCESAPDHIGVDVKVTAESPVDFALKLRLPSWLKADAKLTLNGEPLQYEQHNGYAVISRTWHTDALSATFPKGLSCHPLPDRPDTAAFTDGPIVLAGLTAEQHTLRGDINNPATMLAPHDERRWGDWLGTYQTINQDHGFYLKPLYDIGNETYTVYFTIEK